MNDYTCTLALWLRMFSRDSQLSSMMILNLIKSYFCLGKETKEKMTERERDSGLDYVLFPSDYNNSSGTQSLELTQRKERTHKQERVRETETERNKKRIKRIKQNANRKGRKWEQLARDFTPTPGEMGDGGVSDQQRDTDRGSWV